MRIRALVLGLLALLCAAAAAHAHAVLVEARPADGTTLWVAPRDVVLRFNEPVVPVSVRVLAADGRSVAAGPRAENETLRLPLPDLPDGFYVVSYRVISADSHPVSGSVTFLVGNATPAAPPAVEQLAVGWAAVAAAAARAVMLAALLVLAGGVLALGRLFRFDAGAVARERGPLTLAGAVLAVAAVATLGFNGVRLAGASSLLAGEPWRVALQSSLAPSLATALAGALLALAALWRGRPALALAGSLLAIGSTALTGHAATAAPWPLMAGAVMLHVFCTAYWLGSLRPLLSALRLDPAARSHAAVARFSSDAVIIVALLLVAGAGIAFVQVRHLAMLWQTPYGLILSAKILTVALLLAVAAFNRTRLLPRLGKGGDGAAGALRRMILIEFGLFALVLALTAALGQVEPPRTEIARHRAQAETGQGFAETREQGGRRVTLSVAPARAGHNVIAVTMTGPNGAALDAAEVTLDMALPAAGIEPLRRGAGRDAPGRFTYHSNDLALAGTWRIGVEVLIDDFTRDTFRFEVPVR